MTHTHGAAGRYDDGEPTVRFDGDVSAGRFGRGTSAWRSSGEEPAGRYDGAEPTGAFGGSEPSGRFGARVRPGRFEAGRADGRRGGGESGGRRGGGGSDGGGRAGLGRYALLPLRIFLGVTFIYAGLDKLTDAGFLAASGPGSVGETMRAVRDSSAVPWLVDLALRNPEGFGYALAAGELAVGVGTLVGVLARLAALGGALISLSLWLTVSWPSEPYYYGNDLPYLIGWLPLVLAGAPLLSVDAAWSARRRRAR